MTRNHSADTIEFIETYDDGNTNVVTEVKSPQDASFVSTGGITDCSYGNHQCQRPQQRWYHACRIVLFSGITAKLKQPVLKNVGIIN